MIVFDNSQLLISTANSVMAVVMVQLSLQLFVC